MNLEDMTEEVLTPLLAMRERPVVVVRDSRVHLRALRVAHALSVVPTIECDPYLPMDWTVRDGVA